MVIDVAFDIFQLKLVEPPTVMLDGLAMKELITGKPIGVGGGAAPATIICVVAVMLPAVLEAVSV
jgi:hypothetical protein